MRKTTLVLVSATLYAMSGTGSAANNAITGHWSCQLKNHGMDLPATFDFKDNGDFKSSITVMGRTGQELGTWKISGKTLVLKQHTSIHRGKTEHVQQTLTREILDSSGSRLVLKVGEDGRYDCHR